MAPGVHGNLVYVSTVPGNLSSSYKGKARAVFALDGATGATKGSSPPSRRRSGATRA